jgi:phytoene desaturase
MKSETPRALVIGSGFGGLAAALRLRAQGLEVTVLERNDDCGGRARVFRHQGYTFDAGPTVLTAPFLFDELYALFDEVRADHIDFLPVSPWYRFLFHDGTALDYGGSLDEMMAKIDTFADNESKGYRQLVASSKALFDKGFTELSDVPFHRLSTFLSCVPDLIRLRADRSVYQWVSLFLKNEKLRQAFSIQPLLVGGHPCETSSLYGLIHFLERQWGVTFPRGGMGALVHSLVQLAQRQGVIFHSGVTVEKLILSGDRRHATGVIDTAGREWHADHIVSNADPQHVYNEWFPTDFSWQRWTPRKRKKLRTTMGLFVYYFGTDRTYEDVCHHTIGFGPRYAELLDEIFHHGKIADDFSYYLHRPTATDPSLAPAGHDAFYVLVPVPHLGFGHQWEKEAPVLKEKVIDRLQQDLLPHLREHLTIERIMTPDHFATELLSPLGAGFSIQPILTQSAWFRFHNQSEELDNLYFVGAGTHPGAGVPGVVSSAKVVAKLISAKNTSARVA